MPRTCLVLALVLACSGGVAAQEMSKQELAACLAEARKLAGEEDFDKARLKILEAAKADSADAVDALLKLAIASGRGELYLPVTEALARMNSDEAIEAIVSKVEKKSKPIAKIICIDALGARKNTNDGRAGIALGQALGDKRTPVLRAAIQAIKQRKDVKAVEALIGLLDKVKKKSPLIFDEAERALIEITGKVFDSTEDWEKYWETAKQSFRPRTGGPSAQKLLATRERGAKPKPTFFGTEVLSQRVVFVIDVSGSMKLRERIDKCKDQLKKCIDSLPERSRFTIIAFSDGVDIWKPGLQTASRANKAAGKAYVDQFYPNGKTDTKAAVLRAFDVKGADAMIVLSDGTPTGVDGQGNLVSERKILAEIDTINRVRRWRIDTFGFGGGGGKVGKFMKRLSDRGGGIYTAIPEPRKKPAKKP